MGWCNPLGAFDPFFVLGLCGVLSGPFDSVCPVGRRQGATSDVLGMTGFECFPLSSSLVGADALLSEADSFDLSTRFGNHDVGLCRMTWGSLGLVVSADPGSSEPWVSVSCWHFFPLLFELSFHPTRLWRWDNGLFPSPPIVPPTRYMTVSSRVK